MLRILIIEHICIITWNLLHNRTKSHVTVFLYLRIGSELEYQFGGVPNLSLPIFQFRLQVQHGDDMGNPNKDFPEYLTIYQDLIDAMVIENEETNLSWGMLNSLKSNCEINCF